MQVDPNYGPQWSPPLSGGSTWGGAGWLYYAWSPQWSPPSDGGSTQGPTTTYDLVDAPQWSPPLSGGSTLDVVSDPLRVVPAAMEPAARAAGADPEGCRLVLPEDSAAMEPTAERREHAIPCTTAARRMPSRNGARRSTAGAPVRDGSRCAGVA